MRGATFVAAAALAAVLWATFAAGIGYLGGRAFQDEPWRGLAAALVVAAGIVVGVEATRRLSRPDRRLCGHCSA
jgi:membrane protein DedA with SNARE-associated domain